MRTYHSNLQPILLLVCFAAFAARMPAQEKQFATAGVTEVSGSVSFASISEVSNGKTYDAVTVFSVGPRVGYFITDGFELGFSPGISSVWIPQGLTVLSSGGTTSTILQLFVFPAYTIRNEGSKMYPFVEIPIGYTSQGSGNNTKSGFSWGVRAGLKLTPVGALLVVLSGEYYQITMSSSGATERSGFNYFSFGVGIGGFF